MTLSDIQIRNTKPGPKPFKISDSGGLYLLVNPGGSKLWRMKYRFAGKEKLLSFGPYPIISLKQSREHRDAAKALLYNGHDPSTIKREAKHRRTMEAKNSFRVVADEFTEKLRKEGKAEITIKKLEWVLGMANEAFGHRPVNSIKASEILVPLKKLEKAGKHETARRLRSTIGRVIRYAIATARAESDPTFALQGALVTHKVKSHTAITNKEELGELLCAIDASGGYPSTVLGLKLLALLYPRPGELRLARWGEFDLGDGIWVIPATHTKMRREHHIPLPPQAIAILEDLKKIAPHNDLVLPSISSSKKSISENTLNQGLRRIGYSKDQMTSHGFRATFATIANESNLWSSDAIERALSHVEANNVRRVYTRGTHWNERIKMAAWWADLLDKLREG
ncbi:MAG: integrase [Robiginitomaculum sp.]|nr:MAG: integrase [Robiginitomaculum sp.]